MPSALRNGLGLLAIPLKEEAKIALFCNEMMTAFKNLVEVNG